jgi:UDP-N-acetylglucosamine--N-acetylmuramyl-(pentapeptide) pyrophosphoryl-undecaprenol N-acetylglucosamine transferase
MFPAEALARELTRRGWRIVLATDHRGEAYAQAFPAEARIALDAATGRGPIGLAKAGVAIARGLFKARSALKRLDAAVVVGFGGYPSAPALLAALSQGRPTLLHEQNSVLGRTNRWLSPHVGAVAASFPNLRLVPSGVEARVSLIGNPVRPDIRTLSDRPYAAPKARGPIHVLVTGGSQGARILSEAVPQALAALPAPLRKRLRVQQQSRPEMLEMARSIYAAAGIEAEVAPFFGDMARRLATTHLVIGRAGASTRLRALKRWWSSMAIFSGISRDGRAATASSEQVEAPARPITRCVVASRRAISPKKGATSASIPAAA